MTTKSSCMLLRTSLLFAAVVGASPASAAIYLAPALGGAFNTGTGADAAFVKIDDQWRGSTVLWNEATTSFGSGVAVSQYGWGTGIWGLSDWSAVMAMPSGQSPLVSSWSGTAAQISFGNAVYNANYGATWGHTAAMPDAGMQSDWAASFSGYIRITEQGLYNFGVLYDDGFIFNLTGANGASVSISADYLNPRNRLGFDDHLALDPGLYQFTLGSYNHAEAGVVDLRWQHVGVDTDWILVPTENLVGAGAVQAVPEPSSPLLIGAGVLLLYVRRKTAGAFIFRTGR